MVNTENILKNWRVIFLLLCLLGALLMIYPRYDAFSGWRTNIQKGFDIEGGSRAVLLPESSDPQKVLEAMNILRTRLNIYGLRDIKVFSASDLTGKSYVIVEAAGLTQKDIEEVVVKQGKFDAKIANVTIFTGKDVTVDKINSRVLPVSGGYEFVIPVTLTNPEASRKFSEETLRLSVDFSARSAGSEGYLNETLDLYLDDKLVDSLRIAASLKGKVFDNPSIQGGAATREEAMNNKNQMEAILQSGALPVKFQISSLESVSPVLGGVLLNNLLTASLLAIAAIGLVIFLRYRDPLVTGAIVAMVFAEAIMILGISVAIKWQLDLAAIAGIVVSLGTGVNQEIIMTDEFTFYGRAKKKLSFKEEIKNATFIILAAFGTGISAMLPLMVIGLGSVKGFAITTVIGLVSGMLITRPAFVVIIDEIFSARAKHDASEAAPVPPQGP